MTAKEEFSISTAKENFSHVIKLMQDVGKHTQQKHLEEVARVFHRFGLEKGNVILKRLYRLRKAKADREYYEYTHLPCGCYCDPGGHP